MKLSTLWMDAHRFEPWHNLGTFGVRTQRRHWDPRIQHQLRTDAPKNGFDEVCRWRFDRVALSVSRLLPRARNFKVLGWTLVPTRNRRTFRHPEFCWEPSLNWGKLIGIRNPRT